MTRRLPAEWEPQSAIQFTFPHEESDWLPTMDVVVPCFAKIIETVTQFQKAVVVCKNKAQTAEILRGCQQQNLVLVEMPSNDTWARDHGGITIFEEARDSGSPLARAVRTNPAFETPRRLDRKYRDHPAM